jgi:tripartite-type tricarboxylate transporter receptor subunit TctC
MLKKYLTVVSLVLFFGCIVVNYSHGAEVLKKPVEVLVGFGAGGTFDMMSRIVAEMAPKYIGQPVVVINKPGAGGSTATAEVISSNPDGYKLICAANHYFSSTAKTQKLPFDPGNLEPLSVFMRTKELLIVKGDSPWKSLKDLLDYGRKNPGNLRWGHVGRGSIQHMMGLVIFRKAGIDTVDIPYIKGDADKLPALLGGHVDALFNIYGASQDLLRSGKLKCLAVINDRRYTDRELKDIPTAAESGFPETAKLVSFIAWLTRKEAPESVKKPLMDAFRKICEDPEFKRRIEDLGGDPISKEAIARGPEFFKQTVRQAEEVSVPILKEFGLYAGK